MYQWKETSKEEKKTGGSSVTTYSYDKVWSSTKINSGSFHTHVTPNRERISNPTEWPVDQKSWWAKSVNLGAYKLPDDLIHQIEPADSLPPGESSTPATGPTTLSTVSDVSAAPAATQASFPDEQYTITDGGYYSGFDSMHPEIGDMKITFKVANPQPLSVVAEQKGNSFVPYPTKAGGEISMLRLGTHSATEMFDLAKADAAMSDVGPEDRRFGDDGDWHLAGAQTADDAGWIPAVPRGHRRHGHRRGCVPGRAGLLAVHDRACVAVLSPGRGNRAARGGISVRFPADQESKKTRAGVIGNAQFFLSGTPAGTRFSSPKTCHCGTAVYSETNLCNPARIVRDRKRILHRRGHREEKGSEEKP